MTLASEHSSVMSVNIKQLEISSLTVFSKVLYPNMSDKYLTILIIYLVLREQKLGGA